MKKCSILLLILILIISSFLFAKKNLSDDNESKKVLMIIAHNNFRDEEYLIPKDILTDNGYKVVTASSSLGEAKGMFGTKVIPDINIREARVKEYAAVIFVGGSGATEYWHNRIAHNIAKEIIKEKKVLAAICLGPGTLAIAGVLKNKKATVFISAKELLEKSGAIYVKDKDVVVDENIVTANGPDAAEKFAGEIVKLLRK